MFVIPLLSQLAKITLFCYSVIINYESNEGLWQWLNY